MDINDIISTTTILPQVSLESSALYLEKIPCLTKFIDEKLSTKSSINELIGHNPLQMMFNNHKHHALFMATFFNIANYEMLVKTIVWVYRTYALHKYSYDYFPLALRTWVEAVKTCINKEFNDSILEHYYWMLENHNYFKTLSKQDIDFPPPFKKEWLSQKQSFLSALLVGDLFKCKNIAQLYLASHTDLENFYLQIIQPSMYDVGRLWQQRKISVAQEHLASSIVGRIMAEMSQINEIEPKKGKIVVTTAPNEYHEIGAWMLSDILIHDGWDVKYLGANTPIEELVDFIKIFKPDILAISVTMPFNLNQTKIIIEKIKSTKELANIQVLVGGRAFNESKDLWQQCQADGFSLNAVDAKNILNGWLSHAI